MKKILLDGIQKTGNTWSKFVIFNYFNIKNNGATKTLTWDELKAIDIIREKNGVDYKYFDGFPIIFSSHRSYDGYGIHDYKPRFSAFFDLFDIIIYFYRNPFDTVISYYHFTMDRNVPFHDVFSREKVRELRDMANFTKWFLPKWIYHIKSTKDKADLVLDYDKLRENFRLFLFAIELIDNDIDYDILDQSISMSSFDNIRKMSIDIKQEYGLGGVLYKGFFCRDGRSGQYKEVMSNDLIAYITEECRNEGILL